MARSLLLSQSIHTQKAIKIFQETTLYLCYRNDSGQMLTSLIIPQSSLMGNHLYTEVKTVSFIRLMFVMVISSWNNTTKELIMQEKCHNFLLQDNMIYKISDYLYCMGFWCFFNNVKERTLKYVLFHGMSPELVMLKSMCKWNAKCALVLWIKARLY